MNVNNISTGYTPANNTNDNRPGRRPSILKPLLYTYLTALAVIPVETGDYFEKEKQLEETKEKISKPVVKNEEPAYFTERFFTNAKNTNFFNQLMMANKVDQAQLEKVSDDKFRYNIRLDSKKINGRLKIFHDDKIIYGTAVINDLSKEISKSKEYKFKIVLPEKKSNTFLMKILDNNNQEKKLYTMKRNRDGSLILNDGTKDTVLNKKNAEIYQAINLVEKELAEQGADIQKEKEEQRALQLLLAVVFMIEFLVGASKDPESE